MELRPDVILASKLRLLRPLGEGGMGVVWAARHLTLGTDVAVKLIRPERGVADPALAVRFEREARATARIAHPHVVQVMDFGAVDGAVPYLVMELLRGFTLAELLARGGRLSLATVKSLVQQVGSALESAHAHGIVHRDIKPHNIFILEESKGYPLFVKVLDFGVAKMLGEEHAAGANPALTETGMVIGSAPYMSPEQLEGSKDVDLRSDLWSLGVIVYESLTGAQPFQGSSFVSVGAAVLRGKYRPATELRPSLPRSIDDWIAKALCLEPSGRFQSAPEMVAALLDQDSLSPESESELAIADIRPAAFATTVAVKPEPGLQAPSEATPSGETRLVPSSMADLVAPEGGTVSHAPAARKPEPTQPHRERPRRRGVLIASAVSVVAAAGALLIWRARPAVSTGSPPGMVVIAGATFPMGSPAEGETPSDETPRHAVAVAPFWLDLTEVTVRAYAACTSCERPPLVAESEGVTPNGRSFWSQFCNREGAGDHPINCVDWHQARDYCASLGKRLPTEAEWELAARGKAAEEFPWGAAPPSGARLNACGVECSRMLTERLEAVGKPPWPRMYDDDDSAPATAPVGHYPAGASPAGVMDLAGNVWEWTESHYCPYGKEDCDDSRRVLRGGGWDTVESQYLRAAHRLPSAPTSRGWSIGFRCAKSR
ncbi:MAG: bifunctional serine/threonine-protein kinase/formylglycine-generating enzyme family protein [Byssovorax sp.]